MREDDYFSMMHNRKRYCDTMVNGFYKNRNDPKSVAETINYPLTRKRYLYYGNDLEDDLGLDFYDYNFSMYESWESMLLSDDPLTKGYHTYMPFQLTVNSPTLEYEYYTTGKDGKLIPLQGDINGEKAPLNIWWYTPQQVKEIYGATHVKFNVEIVDYNFSADAINGLIKLSDNFRNTHDYKNGKYIPCNVCCSDFLWTAMRHLYGGPKSGYISDGTLNGVHSVLRNKNNAGELFTVNPFNAFKKEIAISSSQNLKSGSSRLYKELPNFANRTNNPRGIFLFAIGPANGFHSILVILDNRDLTFRTLDNHGPRIFKTEEQFDKYIMHYAQKGNERYYPKKSKIFTVVVPLKFRRNEKRIYKIEDLPF